MEAILPNILFGDGAGCVLVSKYPKEGSWKVELPRYVLLDAKTRNNIELNVTDKGYLLKLNKRLVVELYTALTKVWDDWLKYLLETKNANEIEWVIHPGGKKILEVFKTLNPPLTSEELKYSEEVMKTKGNLVSPTLVFVLEEMLQSHQIKENDKVTACMVGPGPGTEIKMVKLQKYIS